MTIAPAAIKQQSEDSGFLKLKLKRVERKRQFKAFTLMTPLLIFLTVMFFIPILSILYYAVNNPEMSSFMRRTAEAMASWDGRELPEEETYEALVEDLREGYSNKTIAKAALRLNYEISGFRSLVMKTARKVKRLNGPPYKNELIALNAEWGKLSRWHAIKAASPSFTAMYLLAAVDLKMTWDGTITSVPDERKIYLTFLWRTIWVSFVVTLFCVLVGYPIAYLIANVGPAASRLLLLLVLLPFWTSLLVRTAAWVILLQQQGIINKLLISLGLIEKPLQLIFNRFGVYVSMMHILLPFVILPLYSVMKNISPDHMRAAASLGARPLGAFLRVYLPQSLPGLGAGTLLAFILALGFYITPALVGGAGDQMLSYLIAEFAIGQANWGRASALALVLLTVASILYLIYSRIIRVGDMKIG